MVLEWLVAVWSLKKTWDWEESYRKLTFGLVLGKNVAQMLWWLSCHQVEPEIKATWRKAEMPGSKPRGTVWTPDWTATTAIPMIQFYLRFLSLSTKWTLTDPSLELRCKLLSRAFKSLLNTTSLTHSVSSLLVQ